MSCGLISKMVDSTVYVCIGCPCPFILHFQYRIQPLGCGGIVKIDKRLAVNCPGKGWKIFSYILYSHNRFNHWNRKITK